MIAVGPKLGGIRTLYGIAHISTKARALAMITGKALTISIATRKMTIQLDLQAWRANAVPYDKANLAKQRLPE